MEVTKCDRCGAYIDKRAEDMPTLIYASSYENYMLGDRVTKNICYNCYAKIERWFDMDKEEQNADND